MKRLKTPPFGFHSGRLGAFISSFVEKYKEDYERKFLATYISHK